MSTTRVKKKPATKGRNDRDESVNSSRPGHRKAAAAARGQKGVKKQTSSGTAHGLTRTAVRVMKAVTGSNTLVRSPSPNTTPGEKGADMVVSGVAINAVTALQFAKFRCGHVELTDLLEKLHDAVDRVHGGDLRATNALLIAQATTLNAIFNHLATLAAQTDYVEKLDRYLRLGLKAQAQCLATLETVAKIQQPPSLVVRQANIAHGPQQVNNLVSSERREAEQHQTVRATRLRRG